MNRKIILIAPEPPPFGGMANQARLLADCLEREGILLMFSDKTFEARHFTVTKGHIFEPSIGLDPIPFLAQHS